MNNNIVIYSCATGGYDGIKQPLVVYSGVDYVFFSDAVTHPQQVGVWQVRPIPYQNSDNTRRARFVKHNPHVVIPEYKYSVWIDSNIQIVDDLLETRVKAMIDKGSVMAHITHPKRNCIYDEAQICARRSLDKFQTIYSYMKRLKSEGYPRHNGLTETNVIYREHNNDIVKGVSEEWWQYISEYSKRDQLSFFYVAWRQKVAVDSLLPDGVSTHSKEHFVRHDHHKKGVVQSRQYVIPFYIHRVIYLLFQKRKLSYDNL